MEPNGAYARRAPPLPPRRRTLFLRHSPRAQVFMQIRLRAIKGTSSFNICAVPPAGRVPPSVLCQEGARPDAP